MIRVSTGRRATAPVIWITASALAAVPLLGSGPMPTRLAAELTSFHTSVAAVATQAVDDAASAAPTVVSLIARSSEVLGSASVHDLAELVQNPAATQPLTVATPQARVAAQSLDVAADGPSASDSLADLSATLQTILGRFTDAFNGAPGNIGKALTSLFGGDVRGALQTFSSIFTDPIIFVALFDLPNLSAPLSNLVPPLAPVFNALPNIVLNAGLPLLQLVADVNSSLADAYEGARDGILAGDVVQAVYKFASATVGLAQKILDDTIGPQGLLPSLYNAGVALATAVGQVFNPTPPATDTASATTDESATATDAQTAAVSTTSKHTVAGSPSEVTSTAPDAATSAPATADGDAPTSDTTKIATNATGSSETSTGATTSDSKASSSADGTSASSTSGANTSTSNGTTGKSSGAGASETASGASSKTGTDTASTGATKPAKTPSKDAPDASKPEKASSSTAGHGTGSESKGGDSAGGHAGGGDA